MIKPPNYQKDAIPTNRGWVHPRTNEVLVSGSISQKDIDEYYGVPGEVEEEVEEVVEETDLSSLSKKELEDLGREHGVELDRRKSKSDLVEELQAVIDEANEEPIEDDAF